MTENLIEVHGLDNTVAHSSHKHNVLFIYQKLNDVQYSESIPTCIESFNSLTKCLIFLFVYCCYILCVVKLQHILPYLRAKQRLSIKQQRLTDAEREGEEKQKESLRLKNEILGIIKGH